MKKRRNGVDERRGRFDELPVDFVDNPEQGVAFVLGLTSMVVVWYCNLMGAFAIRKKKRTYRHTTF